MQPNEINEVLNRPLSQELLDRDLTRLAYVAKDGTPRSIPIGFTWNGSELVMCTSKNAPKLAALRHNPAVALTIDTEVHPPKMLLIRGQAELDVVEGIPDEYLQMNGSYEMTRRAKRRVGGRGPLALRRHGPDRRDPDVGQADRLRDDPPDRGRGTHPRAGSASTRLSATSTHDTRRLKMPKYLLLKHYRGGPESHRPVPPIDQWAPEDVEAHMAFQHHVSELLESNGEYVDTKALATAQTWVRYGGPDAAPVTTDGPHPETSDLIAGFWMIDVESYERAVELAAYVSSEPGPGGEPMYEWIDVREVMWERPPTTDGA